MRLLAPFDALEEVPLLLEAGAEELYCGVFGPAWRKRGVSPNARPMSYANLRDIDELGRAVASCRGRQAPVFMCLNEYVPPGLRDQLLREIDRALTCGVSGLVVTDMSLIAPIKERSRSCKVVLSSLNPCLNARSLEFFREQGVDRVVLPCGQLSLGEMQELNRSAGELGLELEVFVKSPVCRNIPGYCLQSQLGFQESAGRRVRRLASKVPFGVFRLLPRRLVDKALRRAFVSRSNPRPCRQDASLEIWEDRAGRWLKVSARKGHRLDRAFAEDLCWACSLFAPWKAGIACGKIVGRGCPTAQKVKDVLFAKKYLDRLAQGAAPDADHRQAGQDVYREVYGEACDRERCFCEDIPA